MKAEIAPGGGDELVVVLDASEIQAHASRPLSDKGMRAGLPAVASDLAEGILAMLGAPPAPGEPRRVEAVTLRITRSVVIAELTLPVADREVWT